MSKHIMLGGGCFWCLEAVFQRVKGVTEVISGYAGGTTPHPTYQDIGDHAEVVQITYDTNLLQLDTLLDIFFATHDPTTLHRQGNDIGTQYRSIIIYKTDEAEIVQAALKRAQEMWTEPIVTELTTTGTFTPAETYHQNYYNNNASAGYCQVVINPKLAKLSHLFKQYTTE